MDPITSSALIGAGSSLLGGLLGGGKSAGDNAQSHIRGLWRVAQTLKINPLALLGTPPVGPSQGQNFMGQAIADAGMMMADGLLKRSDAQKLEAEKAEKAALQQKVADLTLRPKVPGVYQQFGGGNVQSDRQAGGAVSSGGGGVGGHPPGGPSDLIPWVDTTREIDRTKVTDDSGVAIVDNPNLGRPFPVPAFNGEPLDLGQAIVVGGSYLVDKGRQRIGQWGDVYRRATTPDDPIDYLSKRFQQATKPRKKPKKRKHDLHALGF